MANIKKIQASLIRGGTSKGLFFSEHLPDQLLALALGSPDETSMQLDGVGGGITSTSKIAIVTPRPGDLDVDYLFGQVDLSSGCVDWSGSCGNLVAAVGIYARESGLVSPEKRTISVWQKNLGYQIDVTYPEEENQIAIPGVPRTSPSILVEFVRPKMSGLDLLPTGNPIDKLLGIDVSLCCCGNPTVFVRASDLLALLGRDEQEELLLPDAYSAKLADIIDSLCSEGSAKMGIKHTDAIRLSWLRSPSNYRRRSGGGLVSAETVDIIGCISTPGRVHHAFTTTGMVNLAAMACIPGTIPYEIAGNTGTDGKCSVSLGQPAGVVKIQALCSKKECGEWYAEKVGLLRTARTLMSGYVHVPLPSS